MLPLSYNVSLSECAIPVSAMPDEERALRTDIDNYLSLQGL